MITYQFAELFTITCYPSGESHVQLTGDFEPGQLRIIAPDVRNFNGLGHVVTANSILRRQGHSAEWFIPFYPFARDDRRNTMADGFELKLAMQMTAHMHVTILDPHSDVVGMMPHIPQSIVVDCWRELWDRDSTELCFIIPDAGAIKKVHTWLQPTDNVVYCTKRRDTATGELSGFAITEGKDNIGGRHCIIVDDICDGGGTFLGLAELIQDCDPHRLSLAVTHGLFTKGVTSLFNAFDNIYTTGYPSWSQMYHISHKALLKRNVRL